MDAAVNVAKVVVKRRFHWCNDMDQNERRVSRRQLRHKHARSLAILPILLRHRARENGALFLPGGLPINRGHEGREQERPPQARRQRGADPA